LNDKKVGNFAFFPGQTTDITFKTLKPMALESKWDILLSNDKSLQIISLSIVALLQRKFLHPFLFLQLQTLYLIRAASIM